jgi:hypothetical protein
MLDPSIPQENRAGYADSATTLKSSPMGTESTIFLCARSGDDQMRRWITGIAKEVPMFRF